MRCLLLVVALCFSASAHAATPREAFMEQIHGYWGKNVSAEDLSIITGDVNSDGMDDIIGWRVARDHFEMMVVVNSEAYGVQSANVRIPIGDKGVCSETPLVDLEGWNDDKRTAHGLNNVGSNAVRIHAIGCDSIFLFWPLNSPHATIDLRLPRK